MDLEELRELLRKGTPASGVGSENVQKDTPEHTPGCEPPDHPNCRCSTEPIGASEELKEAWEPAKVPHAESGDAGFVKSMKALEEKYTEKMREALGVPAKALGAAGEAIRKAGVNARDAERAMADLGRAFRAAEAPRIADDVEKVLERRRKEGHRALAELMERGGVAIPKPKIDDFIEDGRRAREQAKNRLAAGRPRGRRKL